MKHVVRLVREMMQHFVDVRYAKQTGDAQCVSTTSQHGKRVPTVTNRATISSI